jgi:hypothetical protein
MLNRDKDGYIVTSSEPYIPGEGDGGDSCHFMGLYVQATKDMSYPVLHYLDANYEGRRHPTQTPWTNVNNFSRDQLMPLVGALNATGRHKSARRLLLGYLKRGLFFAQNSERDYVGSRKYPFPHYYYKDSKKSDGSVDPTTAKWKNTLKPDPTIVYSRFDSRDILLPDRVGAMIVAARFYPLYFLLPISYLFAIITIVLRRYNPEDNDQGAVVSTMNVLGLLWLLKRVDPNYLAKFESYFCGWRNMRELYEIVKRGL